MDEYSDTERSFLVQHADKCIAHDRAFFVVVAIAAVMVGFITSLSIACLLACLPFNILCSFRVNGVNRISVTCY
jgi:hypothetical protein